MLCSFVGERLSNAAILGKDLSGFLRASPKVVEADERKGFVAWATDAVQLVKAKTVPSALPKAI